MSRIWTALTIVGLALTTVVSIPTAGSAAPTVDSYGLVDPSTGIWHLYDRGVEATWFYLGDPGDYPFMGD